MNKSLKISLTSLLIIAILFALTNPTNKDFEEKIPTLTEFNRFVNFKEECLVYGRKENYIFFSIFEITNNCNWENYSRKPKVINTNFTKRESKRYIGVLKSFRATN